MGTHMSTEELKYICAAWLFKQRKFKNAKSIKQERKVWYFCHSPLQCWVGYMSDKKVVVRIGVLVGDFLVIKESPFAPSYLVLSSTMLLDQRLKICP